MPGIDDIKPYQVGGTEPDPQPRGKLSVNNIKPYYAGASPFSRNVNTSQNPDDYRFQLKSGGVNNDKLRAQDQGFWETMGIKAANFVPNVITGMGEMAGYMGALATEYGKDRDYSNELTQMMQAMKDPFGEIYRENPNQTFDLTDSAWWIDNIGSLAESATQFALPGALMGKAFANVAKLAALGNRTATGVMATGARVATAGALAYSEGAMSGYRIYESAYNNQYQKFIGQGMDPIQADDKAKQIASDAAATTVQMNTLMNTALNMTALAPFFRSSESKILQFMKQNTKKLDGETSAQFTKRIAALAESQGLLKNRNGITSYLSESLQEGLEEVNTQYAEAEGTRVGEGKTKNVAGALAEFGTALTDVTNQEGALNFLLGALGGVAQTAILDNIPVHKSVKTDDGGNTIKKTYVSTRTKNADGTRKYFDSIVDAVAEDIDWHQSKMTELKAATDKGDTLEAERIRQELFDVFALNTVQMGIGENWIETFKEMSKTSNEIDRSDVDQRLAEFDNLMAQTQDPAAIQQLQQEKIAFLDEVNNRRSEAVNKGLAFDENDYSYKQRAEQAIEDIKAYQKIHNDIYGKYNSAEEQAIGVADYMFSQAAGLYRQQKMLERGHEELAAAKAEHDRTYMGPAKPLDTLHKAAAAYRDSVEHHTKVIEKVKADQALFNNAIAKGDEATVQRILEKYRLLGYVGADQVKKLQKMMDQQIDNATSRLKEAQEKLNQSSGFAEWVKEPGNEKKTINDYAQFVGNKYGSTKNIKEMELYLDQLANIVEDNNKRVSELLSDPDNVKGIMRKMKPVLEERRKKFMKQQMESQAQKELDAAAARVHNERNAKAIANEKTKLQRIIAEADRLIAEYEKEVADTEHQIRKLKFTQHSMWNIAWKAKLLALEAKLKRAKKLIEQERNRKNKALAELGQVQTAPPPAAATPPPAQTAPSPQTTTQQGPVTPAPPSPQPTPQPAPQPAPPAPAAATVTPTPPTPEEAQRAADDAERAAAVAYVKQLPKTPDGKYHVDVTDTGNVFLRDIRTRKMRGVPVEEATSLPLEMMPEYHEAVTNMLSPEQASNALAYLDRVIARESSSMAQVEADLRRQFGTGPDGDSQIATAQGKARLRMQNYEQLRQLLQAKTQTASAEPDNSTIMAAGKKYEGLLNRIPGELHAEFAAYEDELKRGADFSEEAFLSRPGIAKGLEEGLVFKRTLLQALNALKEFVDTLPRPKETTVEAETEVQTEQEETQEETGEERSAEEMWDEATAKEAESAPTLGLPSNVETSNAPDIEETGNVIHKEKKAVNALKVNQTSLITTDYRDAQGDYRIGGKLLNPNLDPDILDPDKLQPGTELHLAFDTEYSGTIRVPGVMNQTREVRYNDFVRPDGSIDLDNVPIKIMDEKGKTIGYLPSVEWLTDQYPGTVGRERYRNIVAEIEGPDGTITDNLGNQLRKLRELRRQVKQLGTIAVVINEKGPGTVIMNMTDVNGVLRPIKAQALSRNNPESSMLPDPNLQLGVVRNDTVQSRKGEEVKVVNDVSNYYNAPVVILPMANGEFAAAPLYMPDLSDMLSINTMERAITLYLKHNDADVQKELDDFFKLSGFNLRNPTDLRRFLNQQYTYTQSFSSADTALDPSKDERFLFNITEPVDGMARIMIGWTNSGQEPIYAKLAQGKLDPIFQEAFRQGIATRTKNVNFTDSGTIGINSNDVMNEFTYGGGKWHKTSYTNYNEYVKTYASTYVYGRNQQNGRYVYSANPMITFGEDYEAVVSPETAVEVTLVEEPKPDAPVSENEVSSSEAEDLASSLGMDLGLLPRNVARYSRSESMQQVSLRMLEDLYNFTPPGQRNGKSPQQVYEELLKEGLPYLAEGHNPFTKCG